MRRCIVIARTHIAEGRKKRNKHSRYFELSPGQHIAVRHHMKKEVDVPDNHFEIETETGWWWVDLPPNVWAWENNTLTEDRFCTTWMQSDNMNQVADCLGQSVDEVKAWGRWLRGEGVILKKLPLE